MSPWRVNTENEMEEVTLEIVGIYFNDGEEKGQTVTEGETNRYLRIMDYRHICSNCCMKVGHIQISCKKQKS